MAKRTKRDPLDARVEGVFYQEFSGVQVPIMKLSELFETGKTAAREGRSIHAAMDTYLQSIGAK